MGEFSWNELATTDPAAACDFYVGLFDWVKTDTMDVPGGDRVAQCMDPQGAAFAIHAS